MSQENWTWRRDDGRKQAEAPSDEYATNPRVVVCLPHLSRNIARGGVRDPLPKSRPQIVCVGPLRVSKSMKQVWQLWALRLVS